MTCRAWSRRCSWWVLVPFFCAIVDFAIRVDGSTPRALGASELSVVPPAASTVIWEELIEDEQTGVTALPGENTPRKEWRGLLNPSSWFQSAVREEEVTPPLVPPHPLRTNLWELHCRWRGVSKATMGISYTRLILEFDPTGYVRAKSCDNASTGDSHGEWIAAGTWKHDPAGVTFSISFPAGAPSNDADPEPSLKQHSFETDFHINPFGRQPKFTRGVVFYENGNWLRPVAATFTGKGIGDDTADLSYSIRKQSKSNENN